MSDLLCGFVSRKNVIMPGNPNPNMDGIKKHQFKPGNIGGGRMRKRPISEAADDRVRSPLDPRDRRKFIEMGFVVPQNATVADGIVLALSRKAMAGDVAAAKELRESIEGKSKIRVEVEDTTKRTPRLVVVFEGRPIDPLNTANMLLDDKRTIDMPAAEPAAEPVSDAVKAAMASPEVQEAILEEIEDDDHN